jgi:hypothetical protein
MLTRLIAMLLLFSFGLSAMGECCLVSDGGIFESSAQQDTCCADDHSSTDADDQQPISDDCDDACSACLHTAMTPASQLAIGFVSHTFQYFARESTNLLSRTASIDRPPCWTA